MSPIQANVTRQSLTTAAACMEGPSWAIRVTGVRQRHGRALSAAQRPCKICRKVLQLNRVLPRTGTVDPTTLVSVDLLTALVTPVPPVAPDAPALAAYDAFSSAPS